MTDLGRLTAEALTTAVDAAPDSVSGRAVLVVDDEPAVRRLVAQALRSRGHEVIEAIGGREALRAVYERSSAPDVVLADLDLPGMTGVELAARLSADRPGTQIVLMTGRPGSAALARERPELVAAVLLKPFSLDDVLAAVDAALARRPT
jgi:CheY-like chemotaxis protein